MIPIQPVTEENIRLYYGYPVMVVLRDGTEHIGILSRVGGGKLILNEQSIAETTGKKGKRNARVKAKGKGNKPVVTNPVLPTFPQPEPDPFSEFTPETFSGFPSPGFPSPGFTGETVPGPAAGPAVSPWGTPQNPFGGKVSLDMASVAMLFLLEL
jgi:hypothetical protein